MERYTDAWDKTSFQVIIWDLPCTPGTTFECTRNVVQDIITWFPHMRRKYKKMRGVEITLGIDEAYYDFETHNTWYRVTYKEKEKINDGLDRVLKLLEEYDDLAAVALNNYCVGQDCRKMLTYLRKEKDQLRQELIEHGYRRKN